MLKCEILEISGLYCWNKTMNSTNTYLLTVNSMEESFRKEYDRMLRVIKSGFPEYEPKARALAEEHGYSIEKLEEAIKEGKSK